MVKCNNLSMSETKEEQVQQIQKQNKKKLKLLIVFCMNFQMILFVELVGSLLIFVLRRKKEDTGVCVPAMVKEYICFGGGYTGHNNVVSWFWAGKCSCDNI